MTTHAALSAPGVVVAPAGRATCACARARASLHGSSRAAGKVVVCGSLPQERSDAAVSAPAPAPSRRALLAAAPAAALAALLPAARAGAKEVVEPGLFTIDVPADWIGGATELEGTLGARRLLAWHAPNVTTTSISVLSSNASVEFTSIGGLGTAYEFGFTLVGSQDRRRSKRDPQAATLIDATARGGNYFVEYTIARPQEGIVRHVYEQVALKFDGRYNRLWTVTGVFLESDAAAAEAAVKAAVDSFRLTY